jgi:tetratricopeptide (TPR) repeat protein
LTVAVDDRTRLSRTVDWLGRVGASRRRQVFALAIPGLITFATGVVLSLFDGGYSLTAWYTAALFLLALLALVLTLEAPAGPRLPPLIWGAVLSYAAFVALNYLSILWAAVPGDAWDGANRALVFGLAFALVASRRWPREVGLTALLLTGFGILVVAVGTLVSGAVSDPVSQFVGGRLSAPAGYANAAAALFLMGVFPLLYLAAARILSWPLRGLALGGATVLLQTALLTQSRGGAAAVAVAAVVFIVLVPQRWAALSCMAVAGGLTALQFGTLTDLTGIAGVGAFEDRLADVRATIAFSAIVATAIGALVALAGSRVAAPADSVRRAGGWGLAALAALTAVLAVAAIGNPASWAESRWDDFRSSGYSEVERGDNRFGGSLGSNRYDFYRVALAEFADHPVAGIGSENFLVPYLEQRRSHEAPHFPHSLAFRLLSQLGIVGTLLFLAFLSFALVAVARQLRRAGPVETGIAAAALAAFSVWFAQGLVDWLWAFTGLGIIAFAMLALAARSGDASDGGAPAGNAGSGLGRVVLVAVTIVLAVSLALPGLAARYVSSAYESYAAGSVGVALDRLDQAAELDFLSAEPYAAKGVIAQRSGMPAVAAKAFEQSVEREPDNWFARLELGMSLAAAGKREAAVRQLLDARRLNPGLPVVGEVLQRVRRGRQVDPIAVEAELESRLTSKLRPLAAPGE